MILRVSSGGSRLRLRLNARRSASAISRWIKEHRPHIYFILATGWAERITQKDYDEGRIDAVFEKPYAPAVIVQRADEFLLGKKNSINDQVAANS
jgi:response regulator RpfG family c-di-GMP phosphodiesterase